MLDAIDQLESGATRPGACLWMDAGVVGYKLCDADYECDRCPFDRGLRGRRHAEATWPLADTAVEVAPVFYDPGHVWARVEGGGTVRVGIDDLEQQLLGRVYAVELPRPGARVTRGEPAWRVTHRAGETALVSPVSGDVLEVNDTLAQFPSLLNRHPYDRGWAFRLAPVDLEGCLKRLLYGPSAAAWMRAEAQRLESKAR